MFILLTLLPNGTLLLVDVFTLNFLIFLDCKDLSLTGSNIFIECKRLPIIPINSCLVSLVSACRDTPTFLAIRRIDATFVVELKSLSKSIRDSGDFLSNRNVLSELKIRGGKGNLPSWVVEYTLHICFLVNFNSCPVFCLIKDLRFLKSIPGSHASILL